MNFPTDKEKIKWQDAQITLLEAQVHVMASYLGKTLAMIPPNPEQRLNGHMAEIERIQGWEKWAVKKAMGYFDDLHEVKELINNINKQD